MFDPCASNHIITDANKCSSQPSTHEVHLQKAGPDTIKILTALYKALGLSTSTVQQCVNDVGNAGVYFKDFAADVKAGHVDAAALDLASAISSLSTSVSDCNVPGLTLKLDALAAAIKFAHTGIDRASKFLVDGSDLWNDIEALQRAVQGQDYSGIGSAIQKILSDWTAITGGCSSDACHFIDGLLRVLQVVSTDIQPCENALLPIYQNFTNARVDFNNKNYRDAVSKMAWALDELSNVISQDSCGMGPLTKVLTAVAPKLAQAVVKIGSSKDAQIMVNSLNIYDKLYTAFEDLSNGNIADFGMQMGSLLQILRGSNCQTKICTILSGVLASLQIEASDFSQCAPQLDQAWSDMSGAINSFEHKDISGGISQLGKALKDVSNAVNQCGISELASVLEDTASKLGANGVASKIGQIVAVLVDGSDVTLEIDQAVQDFNSGSWNTFGQDLGNMASQIANTKCKTFVCKLLEGVLNSAAIPFEHLEACETDLKAAEQKFAAGATYFHQKNLKAAVIYFANGMNQVAKAINDCGVTQELQYMEQEANVLGIANTTVLSTVGKVLTSGADFYEEIFNTAQALQTHDYREAGAQLRKVLDQMSQWTNKHACTSDACYVVLGVLQYLGDLQGSVKACENDFTEGFSDFKNGIEELTSHGQFTKDKDHIKNGLRDIGNGLNDLASGVGDCHLDDLAKILSALAAKLGLAPEVQLIEDVLKILIEGVEIEQEIGNAFIAFSNDNWPSFGYNIYKLIKTLL